MALKGRYTSEQRKTNKVLIDYIRGIKKLFLMEIWN